MTALAKSRVLFQSVAAISGAHAVSKHSQARILSSEQNRLHQLLQTMPKETNLRHIKKREAIPNPIVSEAFFQVVGDGTVGSPRVALLVTSFSRYLFNCGEGTQRIIHEHKLKLARVENVFFTTKSWSNIGGLPGLTLTVRDIGVPRLALHGPKGVEDLYENAKHFLMVQDMDITYRPLQCESFADYAVTIKYVPLFPDADQFPSNTLTADHTSPERSPKKRRASASAGAPTPDAVAYIGKLAEKPGQLIISKCIEIGVPPGPLLAQLKDGHEVTLPNGRIVKPSEVCLPSEPGPVFVVVECPTEAHLSSLIRNPAFVPHQGNAAIDSEQAVLVIHFTPSRVVQRPEYQQWTDAFGAGTQHFFINDANHNPSSMAVYRLQSMLNLVDDDIFPLLPLQRTLKVGSGESSRQASQVVASKDNAHASEECNSPQSLPWVCAQATALDKFFLRPLGNCADKTNCFSLDNNAYREEALAMEGVREALEEYKNCIASENRKIQWQESDVIFLGTGSAIPGKVRNTSGILLRCDKERSVILDCGEGSCGQIYRFFDKEVADEELRKIKAIFISHTHADHHIGLKGILDGRRESFERAGLPCEPVWLLVPEPLIPFLRTLGYGKDRAQNEVRVVECGRIRHRFIDLTHTEREFLQSLNMSELRLADVIHCSQSYGISLTSKLGWKICYSGDTVPCDALAEVGMGCDLLIHEATMEDLLAVDAAKKRHSTTSQAIDMGRKMKAKFTLLTHFSQRYAKIPLLPKGLPIDVGIAFDNMHLRFSHLHRIPRMLPALNAIFTEHIEVMQTRTEKKERRRDWEMKAALEKTDVGETTKEEGNSATAVI